MRDNYTRRRDVEDVWCTLKIPRRLAFEWYNDSLGGLLNYAMLLNRSVSGLNLNEEDNVLHNRIKLKVFKQFGSKLDSKRVGAWQASVTLVGASFLM